ncbi:MAG: glucose-1-phosphate cytidylyltransferase [Akkermansiaceae bacterium]|nr:glucose-1-phosphate cytidylyltransferase [Akkermansiaceae bacterium]NNM28840.1 glucose-1-phosphate cytidylyltransferase [Akkermansiaceae bacterium]
MKVVILAGGLGTRISEESTLRPKPMVEVGNRPILWHIMKIYSAFGLNDFVICCGYKGHMIKEYFANYFLHTADVTFDIQNNSLNVHQNRAEPWRVTLVDTGDSTHTGGRIKRIADYIDGSTFCLTYGDGVANVNMKELIAFHRSEGRRATLTAVQPPGRFGSFRLGESDSRIAAFREKPQGDGAWVNGGFFVLEPEIMDYIEGDSTAFELEPLNQLAEDDQLSGFKHSDFWYCMDNIHDRNQLEKLWSSGNAPWKVWK